VVQACTSRCQAGAPVVIYDMRANYITNISLAESSGGWSGFNAAIFESLARHFSFEYVGPVAPPEDLVAKLSSKLWRLAGLRGGFQYFSRRRLDRIALEVGQRVDDRAGVNFFHGSTPWVAFEASTPYACYLDVCFATYMTIYHDAAHFSIADIERIEKQEAEWLRKATRVFFSSAWALEEAARAYDLDRSKLCVAGMGGHVPIPSVDRYSKGRDFLFIALDFEGKGGRVCVDAFRQVRAELTDARLRIVGERPPQDVLETEGVSYEGLLNKSVPVELQRLQSLFASAFALVHPTTKDATPQVFAEAGYHGCPVIAPRSFGIPEMIVDGVSGCLVSAPPSAAEVAARMLWLCGNPDAYARMRRSARAHALSKFTWEQVGDRIASELAPLVA
jgi:glycosyltransferase involved in cell wall biosynthesis